MCYSGQGALRAPNEAVILVRVSPTSRQGWTRTSAQQGRIRKSDAERAGRHAEKAQSRRAGAAGGVASSEH